MKNGILVTLLSLGLIACGGESKKNNNNDSTFGEFSSGIKGVEEQPSLTSADVAEGDSLTLNTINHGNIEHYSFVPLNFTLEQDTQVALVLSSEDEDLNLTVSGYDLGLDSSHDGSNELIVFNALAGELYSIEIDSESASYEPITGNSNFQLKFVEANRNSAGLSADEYLVSLFFIGTSYCSEDGEPEVESNFSGSSLYIINWKAEYLSDSDGSSRESFDSVIDNVFTISINRIEVDEDRQVTNQSTVTYNTNFMTGEITGSASWTLNESQGNYTNECSNVVTVQGEIIL